MKTKPIQMAIKLHFKRMKDTIEFVDKADWCKVNMCNHCFVEDVKVDTYPRKCIVIYTFQFKDDQTTRTCIFRDERPPYRMWTHYLTDMVSMFARSYNELLDYIELAYLRLGNLPVWGRFIWKPDGIFMSGADIAAYQSFLYDLMDPPKPTNAMELFDALKNACLDKIPEFYKLGSKHPQGRDWLHYSGEWT